MKIKIRTSSRHKAQLALWRGEVRILIFDDPAELERGQRPEFRSTLLDSNSTSRAKARAGTIVSDNRRYQITQDKAVF
jgi:hypothetical protein